MRIAYLDCLAGISGDMLLGAFIHVGWNEAELKELPHMLGLVDIDIEVRKVRRKGISAVKVGIQCNSSTQAVRRLKDIKGLVRASSLESSLKDEVMEAFERLAEAEAKVHSITKDEVHFHETGAEDAIVDIAGSLKARKSLALQRIVCSPLPLSRGFTRCSHGMLPLPAPAVLELLKGRPVYFTDEEMELVTPTGALLAVTLSDSWDEFPNFKIDVTGYGAGTHELKTRPNLLRIIVGQEDEHLLLTDEVVEMKTVIDDMNPEHAGYFMNKVFSKGALDAWIDPVFMKKNRPGFELCVIAKAEDFYRLAAFLFTHTTSSGLRMNRTKRLLLPRRKLTVSTRWGEIKAKEITRPGGKREIVPEFEECKEIAERFGVPIRDVYMDVVAFNKEMTSKRGKRNG